MPRAVSPSGRKSLFLFALVGIGIGGAWWWQRPPPEPVYQGHRLSEWLAIVTEGGVEGLTAERLHSFGPGTVPWLAYTAEHGRHPFMKRVPLPLDHAPAWLRRWLPEKWGGVSRSWVRDERPPALVALQRLGREGAPAIPALVRVLERESSGDDLNFTRLVAMTLNATGPSSWPMVEQTLEHGNERARLAILETIEYRVKTIDEPASEADVAKVVGMLVKACHGPDASVRSIAPEKLALCPVYRPSLLASDSFIDEVIRLLSDPDGWVRRQAVGVLANGDRRANGTRAVPRLIELLDDRSGDVRRNAAYALGKFDTVEKFSAPRLRAVVRDDSDDDCRKAAADALQEFGFSAEEESAGLEPAPAR